MKDFMHPSNNLQQTYLSFFHIKKTKSDDIVALLADVTIYDDIIFTQTEQQQECGDEEKLEYSLCCSIFFFYFNTNFLFDIFLYAFAVFFILVIFVWHNFHQKHGCQ